MKLVRANDRYEAISKYGEWEAKKAGFRWDRANKVWWTNYDNTALSLLEYADDEARARLKEFHQAVQREMASSRATDADIDLPAPEGLDYLPYQRAGIAYAMGRPATLLGDEMGLGKTIQAIGVVNADPTVKRVLVICPASLRLNWQREARKWLTRDMETEVVGKGFPFYAGIVIVNYDILAKHQEAIREREWDLLIVDECHYLKNPKAQRTQQVFGSWKKKEQKWVQAVTPIPARRRLFLTGTPIVNRPIELHPILKSIDKARWGNWRQYTQRYCDAHETRFGYDVSGASNLDELQDTLRATCMVRRLKADVLKELPAKRRQVIELPPNGAADAIKAEQNLLAAQREQREQLQAAVELAKASDDPEEYKRSVVALRAGERAAFTETSRIRIETAVAKLPYVTEHLNTAIEAGEKVVVFAHHHKVLDALMTEFGDRAVKLDGRDSMEARDEAVRRFQQNDSVRLFVGGMKAAGVGLTLTAAAHVVFAELDWVPGTLSQAEDRCHRIGQANSVLVQHLVLEGSIDATMVQTIVGKQQVIDKALDIPTDTEEPDWTARAPEEDESATKPFGSKQIAEAAELLTPEEIELAHRKLRYLASVCDGAVELDGMGFNGLDTRIGKELAALPLLSPKQAALGDKITKKYSRQLAAVE